ncbi:MAG TPA: SDR family oxidoreductase [Stellaceae bacterium]|jgi:3-oxoacyl-[acyl-carrier protein] reductase|nr:SDR family oxidoreductase [Stellaceae bacterium]
MTSLFGKTAIITGAANGLGRVIAQRLARDGAYIVLAHDDETKSADAAVRAISAEGGWAIAINADLRHPEAIAKLFAQAEQRLGAGIDIAVAASESFMFRPLVDMSDQDFEQILCDNLFGAFYVMREAARRVNDGGRILAVSHDTDNSPTGTAAFAAAKGGIDQMVRVLAREVGWRGITVNGLAARQEDRAAANRAQALGLTGIDVNQRPIFIERRRFPRDLVGIASLLASDDGQLITGQVLGVTADLRGLMEAAGMPQQPAMLAGQTAMFTGL